MAFAEHGSVELAGDEFPYQEEQERKASSFEASRVIARPITSAPVRPLRLLDETGATMKVQQELMRAR